MQNIENKSFNYMKIVQLMKPFFSIFTISDSKLFIHLSVVKHPKNVLSRSINGSAKQEIGKTKIVVFLCQKIVTIL